MTPGDTTDDVATGRLARRLGRLFRIERRGGFERRPLAVHCLVERRGALVNRLIALADGAPAAGALRSRAVEEALAELDREVGRLQPEAEQRAKRLAAELRLRRGGGVPTGLRDGAGGRLLGEG